MWTEQNVCEFYLNLSVNMKLELAFACNFLHFTLKILYHGVNEWESVKTKIIDALHFNNLSPM